MAPVLDVTPQGRSEAAKVIATRAGQAVLAVLLVPLYVTGWVAGWVALSVVGRLVASAVKLGWQDARTERRVGSR